MLLDIFDPKAPPVAIGIDLGTTHSIVSVVRDEKPQALTTCDGTGLLPSVVHYGDHGATIVGAAARTYLTRDPERTIASVKRLMGRAHGDIDPNALSTLRFRSPSSEAEAATIQIDLGGRSVTPVEVSSDILKSLRQSAVDQLTNVGGAVITVPAYFDDAQRQATKDAGRLAGLEVLRLLNEPTAAALAYGLEKGRNGIFAVFDLGGGTFDITILELDDGVFQVKSTGGDSALGGDDVDRLIASAMLETMGFEQTGDAQISIEPEVVALALSAARDAKHALSEHAQVEVQLPRRGGGEKEFSLTQAQLATMVEPLLSRTGKAARRALRDAEVSPSDLLGVILVGGSTRMPAVRAYVEKVFEQEPLTDVDPDLVVAHGAALTAAALSGAGDSVLLLDVLPLSLGVETMGGGVDKILPRNTTIPTGARSTFTTYADNQTGFDVHVVQGERELSNDCRSLARFKLTGIPPMPAGMARLEIHFSVDENSLLSVSAKELTTGVEQQIEVKPSYGLSEDDIEDMLIDALENGEDDLEARRLADVRVEAERVLLATVKSMETDSALLTVEEKPRVIAAITSLQELLARAGLKETSPPVNASLVQVRLDHLDEATQAWAGRRMNRAIAESLAGHQVLEVESKVEGALGVDAHVTEHERNRAERAKR